MKYFHAEGWSSEILNQNCKHYYNLSAPTFVPPSCKASENFSVDLFDSFMTENHQNLMKITKVSAWRRHGAHFLTLRALSAN